ncbi:MAG: histidine kinase dimerization/phosphoacceptor domain -containing protein [Saprospiraceae bacterium]
MKGNLILIFSLLIWPLLLQSQVNTPLLEEGEKLFQKKDYKGAYAEFEKAYLFYKENGKSVEMLEALFQMGRSNTHSAAWDESLTIFNTLENEARNANQKEMVGRALDAQISILYYFKRLEEAENKAKEILKLENISDALYSNAYNTLGLIAGTNGKVNECNTYLLKAYRIDSLHQDSTSLPYLLTAIASNNEFQGKYAKAIRTYLQAISTTPSKDSFKLPTIYSRLGRLFLEIRNTEKAEAYFSDAMILSDKYKHKSRYAKCILYMGDVARVKGQIRIAEGYYQTALEKFKLLNNPEFEYNTVIGLMKCALKKDDLFTANKYLQTAEEYLKKLDGVSFKRQILNDKIEYHLKSGDLVKAEKGLNQVLKSTEDFERIGLKIRTYKLANDFYVKKEDFKNAYFYNNKYQQLQDSIFEIQKSNSIYDLEAKYQKAEQDLAIAQLDASNKNQSQLLESKNRTIVFGGLGLLALGILGAMGLYLFHLKQKTAEELAQKNKIVSKALADKELLLREIHHRVKNNLQVISSLLRLQSKYIKDDNALSALNEGRNRVQSMALIHQNLYQDNNLMGIQIKDYFEKLIQSLFDSYKVSESRIALNLDIDPITLDVDTVVPLGLIVNELVSNTFKHAFPDERSGSISVSIKEAKDQRLNLTVSDDGVGMKEIAADTNKDSFGYKMIRAFKNKLEAELEVTSQNGTQIELLIKDWKKVEAEQ